MLDQHIDMSFFSGPGAQSLRAARVSMRELASIIERTEAPAKAELPWLKAATFGDQRTPKGSLRHNANVTAVTGVELDYDEGVMQPAEAVRQLRAAGVAAMVYTSPSHSLFKPRWRVLAPLSGPVQPEQRRRLAGVLNAILGNVAAQESFTLSQAFYFGCTPAGDDHHVTLIEGKPLDYVTEVQPSYPAREASGERIELPPCDPAAPPDAYAALVLDRLCTKFYEIEAEGARHQVLRSVTWGIAPFVKAALIHAETVVDEITQHLGRTPFGGEIEALLYGAVERVEAYAPPTGGAEFDTLPPLPEPQPPARFTFGPAYRLRDASCIPPREWLYAWHYIRKFVTVTVSPGGVGKSSLALVEALDMATGRGLLGRVSEHRRRVVYWNGEDPLEETERRVVAACLHYGITAEEIGDRLVITSGRDLPIVLARDTRDGFAIATPLVEEMTAELIARGVDALVIDPFVKSHAISENDNNKVDAVATQWATIADRANCSIELIHHLRKASGPAGDRTAEDARGGVALIAAARSVRVLNRMSDQDAADLGVAEDVRRLVFRVDDGKANLQPPRGKGGAAIWRRLSSVALGNVRPGLSGDNVGVVEPWLRPAVGDSVTEEHVAAIHAGLLRGQPNRKDKRSPDWAGRWIGEVLGIDLDDPSGAKRVEAILQHLVTSGALVSGFVRDEKGRSKPILGVPESASPSPPSPNWGNCRELGVTNPTPLAPTSWARGCGGVGVVSPQSQSTSGGKVELGAARPDDTATPSADTTAEEWVALLGPGDKP